MINHVQPWDLAFSKFRSSSRLQFPSFPPSSCPFVSFCSRRSDQLEGVALHAVRRIKATRQLLRSIEDLGGVELMKKTFRCSKPEMSSLYILYNCFVDRDSRFLAIHVVPFWVGS
jgi:hypothetical protein